MNARGAQERILTARDFEQVFGEEISAEISRLVAAFDFRYAEVGTEERDRYLLEILKRLGDANLAAAGPHRLPQWETGWGENLENLEKNEADPLLPKIFREVRRFALAAAIYQAADEKF